MCHIINSKSRFGLVHDEVTKGVVLILLNNLLIYNASAVAFYNNGKVS